MLPTKYDFSIYRGDQYQKQFAFFDIDANGLKIPVDLTGIAAKCQVRDSNDLGAILIFEFAVNVSGNTVTISLTPDATKNLDAGKYYYDLQLGNVTKLYGKVSVIGDVTHD